MAVIAEWLLLKIENIAFYPIAITMKTIAIYTNWINCNNGNRVSSDRNHSISKRSARATIQMMCVVESGCLVIVLQCAFNRSFLRKISGRQMEVSAMHVPRLSRVLLHIFCSIAHPDCGSSDFLSLHYSYDSQPCTRNMWSDVNNHWIASIT